MNRTCRLTGLIGVSVMLAPVWVLAQTPTVKEAPEQAPAATVPVEQQPSRAQLNNLFEVMKVREQLASMTKAMPQIMQNSFAEQFKQMQKSHPEMAPTTDEQRQAVAKIMGRYMDRAMKLYSADEMIDDMAGLYQKHLTSSDVDAMIGFYSSPAGEHMLAMAPVIMQEYMPTVMKRMQERLQPAVEDMGKEMAEAVKPPAPADQPAKN